MFKESHKKSSKNEFLWLLTRRSLRILLSEIEKISCILLSMSFEILLFDTEQSPVNSLYVVLNCSGLTFSCIVNDNSFCDCFLWQRDAYFGRSFFICSMALCLCISQFLAQSFFKAKITLPPTEGPYDLVTITTFDVEISVSFSFLRMYSDLQHF